MKTKRIGKVARLEAENAELRAKIATLEATIQRLVMAPPPVQFVPMPVWPQPPFVPAPGPTVLPPIFLPLPSMIICGGQLPTHPDLLYRSDFVAHNAGCAPTMPPEGTIAWVGKTGLPTTAGADLQSFS